MMGSGPYYLDYIDSATGYFRLKKFDNYWGGWAKPHVSTVIHEVVDLWATRKTRFLSNDPAIQADMVTVLRGDVNDPDLTDAIADGRVRYLPELATLSADAIFYCYDFDPTSPYMHHIGDGAGNFIANTTLLSDIHMRLALTYCLNITEFIQDYYSGEAAELHNPVIYGIAYANATKHRTMAYEKNLALATYHFKMAWGGIDADGNPNTMDDVTPGEVWTKGFHITIVPFPDQAPRTEPARMIEYVVENEIPWGIPAAWVDVEVYPLDWSPGLTAMYSGLLGCYIVGWLADFPDPHNWVGPFEASWGDFSYFQNIVYGRQTMNWHPGGGYGPAGLPYLNYKGDLVTVINNTYVDGLIDTGMGIVDTVLREKLYNELMDIYYAECASIMTFQPEGRHYERSWVQGWFYHSIYPGLMFYGEMNLWKQDPATVNRDLRIVETSARFEAKLTGGYDFIIHKVVHNNGAVPEWVDVYIIIIQWHEGQAEYHITTVKIAAWLRPCHTLTVDTLIHKPCVNIVTLYYEYVEISDWIPKIIDWTPGDNTDTPTTIPGTDRGGNPRVLPNPHKAGDFGVTPAPAGFWSFDNDCNYKDASLFRYGYVTAFHELTDMNGDNTCNYKDAGLFRKAYLGV
jgi:peptide/nickel transport system substrate-binding protein